VLLGPALTTWVPGSQFSCIGCVWPGSIAVQHPSKIVASLPSRLLSQRAAAVRVEATSSEVLAERAENVPSSFGWKLVVCVVTFPPGVLGGSIEKPPPVMWLGPEQAAAAVPLELTASGVLSTLELPVLAIAGAAQISSPAEQAARMPRTLARGLGEGAVDRGLPLTLVSSGGENQRRPSEWR